MTKSVTANKKPRKQQTPEFHQEALRLAERIGVAAAYSGEDVRVISIMKGKRAGSQKNRNVPTTLQLSTKFLCSTLAYCIPPSAFPASV